MNSQEILYISFFTSEGHYPVLAERLRRSLDRLDLRYDIEQRAPFASWAEGCRFKSSFILAKLLQRRGPVVWLDIDTELMQRPVLFDDTHDFAIYNWKADTHHHLDRSDTADPAARELVCSGGVQKWGYTAPAMELLMRWISSFDAHDWSRGDDPLLDRVFNTFLPPVQSLWLPKTYNRMAGLSHHWAEVADAEVVIEHHYTRGGHRRHTPEAPTGQTTASGGPEISQPASAGPASAVPSLQPEYIPASPKSHPDGAAPFAAGSSPEEAGRAKLAEGIVPVCVTDQRDGGVEFTNSWFQTTARRNWEQIFPRLQPTRILEIGSYEGASTCYLIETLGRQRAVEIYSIDTWAGGVEHENIDMGAVESRFDRNVARAMSASAHPVEVVKCRGRSDLILAQLIAQGEVGAFDFIYVDGSHQAPDVLCDAVLAFRLLRTGGIIGFDDYLWSEPLPYGSDPVRCPKPAIDAFTTLHCRQLQVLPMPLYQLYAVKTAQ